MSVVFVPEVAGVVVVLGKESVCPLAAVVVAGLGYAEWLVDWHWPRLLGRGSDIVAVARRTETETRCGLLARKFGVMLL